MKDFVLLLTNNTLNIDQNVNQIFYFEKKLAQVFFLKVLFLKFCFFFLRLFGQKLKDILNYQIVLLYRIFHHS